MQEYVKAKYRRSIFESDKGFMIAIFKVIETDIEELIDFTDKTITVTGYFNDLNKDDSYVLYGNTLEHPKYGFQFEVKKYERIKPNDKEGIVEFLASDLFQGVGEALAKKIVNKFGNDTLDIILQNKSNLLLVPKMSKKKADLIYDTLVKYEESHKTIVYLTELGFNMKDSLKIYNKYHDLTINNIENNIYKLLDDIEDISFTKVDQIADTMHLEKDDERRIKALIIYIIKELMLNGDTYFYKEEIYDKVYKYLKIELDTQIFLEYLTELTFEAKIVEIEEKYYLSEIYLAEQTVAHDLMYLSTKPDKKIKDLTKTLESMEVSNGIIYDCQQKKAIVKALENNITIITGGPGTGKTTIIKAITEAYQLINKYNYETLVKNIALLAPTGRASKRMSEATNLPATTIHRFLKWNKELNSFAVNEYNKDFSHLIIVDEASMIDINLFKSLLDGLTKNIKLVIVGDFNQLPSVGPGQVLKDLIESDCIDTIHLNLLYRQDKESYIPVLAKSINDSEHIDLNLKTIDFTYLECNSNSIENNLKNLCNQLVDKNYSYKRVQLMAPMYATQNGIDNLNKTLQDVFNKKDNIKKEIKFSDIIFRENDKILLLVNMPDENVFNGDIGIIEYIKCDFESDSKKNEIYVNFDGNLVKFLPSDFHKLKHGFIISIHKSQGSEFELVILPMSLTYNRMLYKKLIYTAVTRAKKKLIIIGDSRAFYNAVSSNITLDRKTSLKQNLLSII